MRAYLDSWKRFADFSGKTSRRDYWVACFAHAGIYSLIALVGGILLILIAHAFEIDVYQLLQACRSVTDLYVMAWLVPYLAMTVRRVRDAGYSSKLLVLWIIPPVGLFALLVRLFMKSADEEAASQTTNL